MTFSEVPRDVLKLRAKRVRLCQALATKVRTPMRIKPLLIGLGLLYGTAAISSQAAGQGAAKIDATKIDAPH